MARTLIGLVTWADLAYMEINEGLSLKQPLPQTDNTLPTKSEIETYVNLNTDLIVGYDANQYVAYGNIESGINGDITNPYNTNSDAEQFTFNLNAPNGYSATDDASWITFSPNSSLTDEVITVNVSVNNNTSSRSGSITFTDTVTGQTFILTIQQEANAGVATDQVTVGYSSSSSSLACSDFDAGGTLRWIPQGQSFMTASELYGNSLGTVAASAGWYAESGQWRYWSGSSFTNSGICGF